MAEIANEIASFARGKEGICLFCALQDLISWHLDILYPALFALSYHSSRKGFSLFTYRESNY